MAGGTADTYELDAIDRRIITELVADSRISMRALAEKAHISRAHAYVRIERLQDAGIITGFTTRIAHEKAGLGSSAYVALSIRQHSWRGLATSLRHCRLSSTSRSSAATSTFWSWFEPRTTGTAPRRPRRLQGLEGFSRPKRG